MHAYSVNYRKDKGHQKTRFPLVNVGFWINGLRRPTVRCWLLGHKPVVDGTGKQGTPGHVSRWVACDRCGLRPNPQGSLDSDLTVGQPYEGFQLTTEVNVGLVGHHAPGPFSKNTGTVGGQLVLLGHTLGPSVGVTVGSAGGEHDLAAHVSLGRLGALYLHGEGFGRGIVRRLNPNTYEDRVTSIGFNNYSRSLEWEAWRKSNEWSKSDPWWMGGSVKLDPRDVIWGDKRYWTDKVGPPLASVLSMPEEDYSVNLQLERVESGRPRGRKKLDHWAVSVSAPDSGIPVHRSLDGNIMSFGVKVTEIAVEKKMWEQLALAEAARRITMDRVRNGFNPLAQQEVEECLDASEW